MSTARRAQIVTALSVLPDSAGQGIAYLGPLASDQAILRRPASGSSYLVVEDLSGAVSRSAAGATVTADRLRRLGIVGSALSLLAILHDLRLYRVDGSGFGDTPGLGGDTAQRMAAMNRQFLALQEATQMESRKFQTLSSASKARHEIALNTIRNSR